MRHLLLTLALGLAAIGPARAQTLKDFMAAVMDNWTAPTTPFKVIDNIYYVGTKGLAVWLITSPQGHVLIDTAMPQSTSLIKANIETLGFKLADIKVLANTHAHFDHTGGLAELKKETGATLVAGAADKPLLESGLYPGQESTPELKFPPVVVDRAVKDGEVVTVGPIRLVAHATPGHSPGCTTWTTDARENGETHGVIFFCSATVALNQLVAHPTYPGIVEDYRRTFEVAPKIAGDVFLAPHAEMFGLEAKRAKIAEGAPNPFIKAGEFQAFVGSLKTAFDAALAKQQAAAQSK